MNVERGRKRGDGDVEATFIIPRVPTDDISPEEIECVNIRNEQNHVEDDCKRHMVNKSSQFYRTKSCMGWRQKEMPDYRYYVYSSSFIVRVGEGTTERLTRDGIWEDYPYRWEVLTEGRELKNEKKALEKAEQLLAKQKRRETKI